MGKEAQRPPYPSDGQLDLRAELAWAAEHYPEVEAGTFLKRAAIKSTRWLAAIIDSDHLAVRVDREKLPKRWRAAPVWTLKGREVKGFSIFDRSMFSPVKELRLLFGRARREAFENVSRLTGKESKRLPRRKPDGERTTSAKTEVGRQAKALGLTWKVTGRKHDWAAIRVALDAFGSGDTDHEEYPWPIHRLHDVISDRVFFGGEWLPPATTKVSSADRRLDDLSPLERLRSLSEVDISWADVTDLSPLANLTSLRTLGLLGTKVADLTPLSRLTELRTLNLRKTRVSDLGPLRHLRKLQTLHLGGIPARDLGPLHHLEDLRELHAIYTRATDLSPLEPLAKLETLRLGGNRLTSLRPLAKLRSLRVLEYYVRDGLPAEQRVAQTRWLKERLPRHLPRCQVKITNAWN